MYVYMKVTKDKYELPVVMAESPRELAAITGDNVNTITTQVSREKAGNEKYGRCSYVKVELEHNEQGECDDARLKALWDDNKSLMRQFSLNDFFAFCHEWDSACKRLRVPKKRRIIA